MIHVHAKTGNAEDESLICMMEGTLSLEFVTGREVTERNKYDYQRRDGRDQPSGDTHQPLNVLYARHHCPS